MVTFRNPIRQPWDGMVANTGVYVRYEGRDEKETDEAKSHKFLILAVNCATWAARWSGSRRRACSSVPVTAASITATANRLRGRPHAASIRCVYRVTGAGDALHLEIQAPHFPTLQDTEQHPAKEALRRSGFPA